MMKMNRYVLLFTCTTACIAGTAFWGNSFRDPVAEASAVVVEPATVEQSVLCTGKVEFANSSNVFATVPSMVKKVYVQVGDTVEQGQLLMDVTPDISGGMPEDLQTFAQYFSAYQQSGITGGSSSLLGNSTELTAPISGTVASISIDGEGHVGISQPAVVITGSEGLQVRLSVNESQVSEIQVGQRASITGTGFKDSTYTGYVKGISGQARQNVTPTGTETVVDVLVSIENPGEDIKPGYTAKAKIITAQKGNILLVPYSVVQSDDDGREYVYKLQDNRAVKTFITTSGEYEYGFSVSEGLSENDVVLSNPDNLSNGTRIVLHQESVVTSDA